MIAANSPAPEPDDEEQPDQRQDERTPGDEIREDGQDNAADKSGQDGESRDSSDSDDSPKSTKKSRKDVRRDRPRGIESLDKAIDEDKKLQHWHRWRINESERRSVVLALLKIVRTKNAKIADKLKAVERLQEIDRLNIEAEKKGPPPIAASSTPIQDAVAELERKAGVELDTFARRILIAQTGQPGNVCLGEQPGKVDSGPAPTEN